MSKKIGWQKYEDMLKKQISSPLASIMMSSQLDLVEEEDYLEEDVFEEAEMIVFTCEEPTHSNNEKS